ncbi:MAG: hypothetical protein NUV55_02620 [Sulfuricaulis sp.]|uniref:hypothetical protein n=1 Tax=Sulfuricaulis sp. TaxID=2003553 RepID=UPI0025EC32D0|nr:hypothetical protein [Sulfuricaulis sp.]MCR4346087.1 hypothetical protein [Sulfuricaulis sp.]
MPEFYPVLLQSSSGNTRHRLTTPIGGVGAAATVAGIRPGTTRQRAGIHPFCITTDESARDYLAHMYGAVNWTLVDDVRKLPLKVSDIYRRLTL